MNLREKAEKLLDELYPYSSEDENYESRIEFVESALREAREEGRNEVLQMVEELLELTGTRILSHEKHNLVQQARIKLKDAKQTLKSKETVRG